MKSSIKFALICCVVSNLILLILTPIDEGWFVLKVMDFFGYPLFYLVNNSIVFINFLKWIFRDSATLILFTIINVNVFIVSYLCSKVYFLLKRLMNK